MKSVRRPGSAISLIVLGTLVALLLCPRVFALDPSLDVSQYAHTSWKIADGFPKGIVNAIAQTPDGYIWLGTEFGLVRFDGIRGVAWQPPTGEHLPSDNVRSLLAARDGTLWIGTLSGLASWKNGKLTVYPELAGRGVTRLLEGREGTVWVNGFLLPAARLCAIRGSSVQCFGDDGSFGVAVGPFYEDSRGILWVGATTGLWRWKPGPPKRYPIPDSKFGIGSLIDGDNGALLISTKGGIRQLVKGKVEVYPLTGSRMQSRPQGMLRDRDGGLWIGTDTGIVHVHQGRMDVFAQVDGLSGDAINTFLEDREGNVWVSSLNGLDRFRDLAVPTISLKQGLSNTTVNSVLAAKDGSMWVATLDGLNRWTDGRNTIYRERRAWPAESAGIRAVVRETTDRGLHDNGVDALYQDEAGRIWVSAAHGIAYFENGSFVQTTGVPGGYIHAITGDRAGNLWIANQNEGLFHLQGTKMVEHIPWTSLGAKDLVLDTLSDPVNGSLWLGFSHGGLAYFKDGQVRSRYAAADGLGRGRVMSLQLGSEGALWASTEGGLSRIKDGHIATLTSKNGLPCDAVLWMMEDDARSVWLYMACGLVRLSRTELDAWVIDPTRTIHATVFDSTDGVRPEAAPSVYSPVVVKTTDGKLWFATYGGVSVVDPRHLPFNRLPPPVHIEQIVADGKTYDLPSQGSGGMHLPPRVRDLAIDYTALSLVVPEKVRYRFKLEGQDADWREVVNQRRVEYSNLPPRHYRFRVLACNNSGVWNEEGAALDFAVDPAYWQTNWFRALCAAACLGMLWGLYLLRVRQLAHQFDMTVEARVGERTRIARELHDTLLQSFQGLMLRFQTVDEMLPARPMEAKEALEGALERADQAIIEGRDAISDIRGSTVGGHDLAKSMTALMTDLSEEHTAGDGGAVTFRVLVEGTPRSVSPILQDEIYRIARESLRNAFRHAEARSIETEITYSDSLLRLRFRDDGKGIDPRVLERGGRSRHWGLPGMRERAKQIGAELEVWSELGAGTEIELSIPGLIAYEASSARGGFRLFRRRTERDHEHRS